MFHESQFQAETVIRGTLNIVYLYLWLEKNGYPIQT